MKRMQTWTMTGLAIALLLLVTPVLAEQEETSRIKAGYDVWETLGSGATSYNFANDPLPKGFFCPGSKAFGGRLEFEGRPIATEPEKVLGTTDTVIERLDDVVFDADGVGNTRIQIKGLNLAGRKTIENACGSWRVEVGLDKSQPVTDMKFIREYANGGYFEADLWVNAQIDFVHEKTGEVRSVTRLLNLPSAQTAFACGDAAVAACPTLIGNVGIQPLGSTGKLAVSISPVRPDLEPDPDQCAVSCGCNGGQCLPIYSWHVLCPHGNPPIGSPQWWECEMHFTFSPCTHPYYSQVLPQCQDGKMATEGYREQLDELKAMGILNEEPAAVLKRMDSREK